MTIPSCDSNVVEAKPYDLGLGEEVVDVNKDSVEPLFGFREVFVYVLEEELSMDDEDMIGSYA